MQIFSFGIGNDVNTHLLDRIASQTRARSQYVLPDEDIELKVGGFYSKIKDPVLSDVSLTFSNAETVLASSSMSSSFGCMQFKARQHDFEGGAAADFGLVT